MPEQPVESQSQQSQQGQQRQQRQQRPPVEEQPVEAQQQKQEELSAKLKQAEHSVILTDAERIQRHFAYAMAQRKATVGESPYVYHLCHNHRAEVITHVSEVTSDNAALVDTQQCLLCQHPLS